MDIGKTFYARDRGEWRKWLEANYDKAEEIWLLYPYKESGNPRIPYNDAVEEALCFGWIDSNVKKVDDYSSAQRFSRRKPGSEYSQSNKERLKWLVKEGKIHSSMQESIQKVLEKEFVFPPDILEAVKASEKAWENYQHFSPAYQRIRIAYIEGARNRPDEFRKRLSNFIAKTEQNKQIGFGGIEKHY